MTSERGCHSTQPRRKTHFGGKMARTIVESPMNNPEIREQYGHKLHEKYAAVLLVRLVR